MAILNLIYDRFLLNTKKRRYLEAGIRDHAIGNTPLIRLFHYSNEMDRLIYAKMESENPTRSAKDRVAQYILNKAIQSGRIQKGSTIIEASSGNTGLALARLCNIHGFKCIITIKDKVSANKIEDLKNLGAEVIVCPSSAKPSDPNNYVTKAKKLEQDIQGAFYVNQNYNLDNSNAHFHSTGPEIWEQSGGKITHLVGCIGTGGTLSGTAKFLKNKNPHLKVIAVDAVGSVLQHYFKHGQLDSSVASSYNMDGVGKKFIPANVLFEYFDSVIQVEDKSSALKAIELKDIENIFVGHSSGAIIQAIEENLNLFPKDAHIVCIFPDHGSKYESSIYSDEWMKEKGFKNA